MTTPVAGYIVSLGQDGSVRTQDIGFEIAVAHDPELAEEVTVDHELTDIAKQELQALAHKGHVADGKLIMKEEIAEGHITWKSLKLFLAGLGGNYPVLFFSIWLSGFILSEFSHIFGIWFLGYWGTQYEIHPPSEVNEIL